MQRNAYSPTQKYPKASWDVVLITFIVAAFAAFTSVLLFFNAVPLNTVPDARNGLGIFYLFVALLTGLSVLVAFAVFSTCQKILKVKFSRFVMWGAFPVLIGIPIFVYALIGVAYVHP